MKVKVGQVIDLPTHPLTRSQGVRGTGTITAVKVTDPVNHTALVIVRTPGTYLHLRDVRL